MWYKLTSGALLNLSLVETLPDPIKILHSKDDTVVLKAVTGFILVNKKDAQAIRQAIIASRHIVS